MTHHSQRAGTDALSFLTIHEAHELLVRGEVTSVELTRSVLDRLEKVEPQVRAFVTLTPELAMEQARRADGLIRAGKATPLTGIPAAIKDNLSTQGVATTCSSRMLENFVSPYDATVIRRLREAGLVMVGKANMDEFAMGSSTENSAFFPTHNPWALDRVPGGSSGGSAAAVAAGEAVYGLGSDTGGSIRQPAGFCNVTGLKPTYGLVSRYGLVAFASSLDQIGPLTRDVMDCALVMNAIAGHDPLDSTSAPYEVPDYTRALVADPSPRQVGASGRSLKGLRLGVPQEYLAQGVQPEVEKAIREAIVVLQALGAEVDWADTSTLPHTKYALACYYILAPSEAMANLARYDGVKYGFSAPADTMWEAMEKTRQHGFGPEVKRRIMLGTYALSAGYYDAYYLKAQKVRTLIRQEFDEAFKKVDALITPTSPTTAFKLGEKVDDPLQMYLSDVCTIPVNIAGIPGLNLPCGFDDGPSASSPRGTAESAPNEESRPVGTKRTGHGLPIGMQVLGPPFSEETLFRIGYAYQQATDWHKRKPEL